jgi:hypothetical protein
MDESTAVVFKQNLTKWKYFKLIIDRMTSICMTERILNATTCAFLNNLIISFMYIPMDSQQSILSSLLMNLGQAPALSCFTPESAIMKLDNLEILHENTPRLKDLYLCGTFISAQLSTIVVINTASAAPKQLKSFNLELTDVYDENKEEELGRPIAQWIAYIGQNYKFIDSLSIRT